VRVLAAVAALSLLAHLVGPVVDLVHTREVAGPFRVTDRGMNNLTWLSDEKAGKVSLIRNANIEDVFKLELNPKADHYAAHSGTALPQEFEQHHSRYYPAFRPLCSGRNTYAPNFAPVAATEFSMKSFGRAAETKVLDRWIPDEIDRRGLSGVSDHNLDEWLNVIQSDDALRHVAEYDCSRTNLDIGPDLGLADTPRFSDLFLASAPNGISCPPQEDGRDEQQPCEQGDEKPLVFVYVIDKGRYHAPNPAGDWMALIIIAWFMIPVAAIYWWIEWLFMGWLFATAAIALLGLK
jgi:hypothetical protein